MSHEKIEPNIYFDSRCTKAPYYVSIMRRGHSLYKKFSNVEEAREAKKDFVDKHSTQETKHPFVFVRDDKYVIEMAIEKSFDTYEEAEKKAELLRRFIDN